MRLIAVTLLSLGLSGCTEPLPAPATRPSVAAPSEETSSPRTARESNQPPVQIHMFVMSQCPFCKPVEAQLAAVKERFGPEVELKFDFVGEESPEGFASMHGPSEVIGDLLEICAFKHSSAGLEFMNCENDSDKEFADWRTCAKKVGISERTLEACATGKEGKQLLAESFKTSRSLGITGTPTILIDGAKYAGNRKAGPMMRAICKGASGLPSCDTVPPAPTVLVKLLVDKRCADCDLSQLEGELATLFEAPAITKVEVTSPEGRELFDKLKPMTLPAVFFDKSLESAEDVPASLLQALRAAGPGVKFLEVGEWNPSCADAGGCKLGECKLTLTCRKDTPKTLELFAMSRCPHGAKAILSLQEVRKKLKKRGQELDLSIEYIGEGDKKSGFSSMRGKAEVDDDLRDLCAMLHYKRGQKFMDYLACRAADPSNDDWEACAKSGIDPKVIRTCAEGEEGKDLLEKSFAVSRGSGQSACPSWIVNGKFTSSGNTVEAIEQMVCAHNDLAICDKLGKTP